MQFIANGPDVPETLLQAHEEGRVIFFCGAGISYPAGLPGFRQLVDRLFDALGTAPDELEAAALTSNRLDAAIDLLEHRFPGRRDAVRAKLPELLTPLSYRKKATTATHKALIDLGTDRRGALRLVTTNFDRIFEHVANGKRKGYRSFAAPQLPIPKLSRWNGLVYLHGLLEEAPEIASLNRLVLSSGDFGLAYLTERWAARFVSELFRNYTVCFIGYSIDDPVVRYMMDALAADKMLGEFVPEAYAFGSFSHGRKASANTEWRAKGVTPILYECFPDSNDHSLLHRTLWSWADTYRDGSQGKERIVTEYAMARPIGSTEEDNFVGRMLWALSDAGGRPAKRFADAEPCPSIDWLASLSEARYRHVDLARFGVETGNSEDETLRFSLIDRPSPHTLSPRMSLFSFERTYSWDQVMRHLAQWLIRHLNSSELLHFVIRKSGRLAPSLVSLIQDRLNQIEVLEKSEKQAELHAIVRASPDGVPDLAMRKLWQIVLSDRLKTERDLSIYQWKNEVAQGHLTRVRMQRLRDLLSPRVQMEEPYRHQDRVAAATAERAVGDIVRCEVVLAASGVSEALKEMSNRRDWSRALRLLLPDLELLLRDACVLMSEIGSGNEKFGRSHWDLPSVSDHWQNRGFHDWTLLIELMRDAWLALKKGRNASTATVARSWAQQPFGAFKRLALFAAARDRLISDSEWISWLEEDDNWWLWSVETMRETMRVIAMRGKQLRSPDLRRLEKLILAGPPRRMFKRGLSAGSWDRVVASSQWLRLAKLQKSGASLSSSAASRLRRLSGRWPNRRLAKDQSDEFATWMGGTGDPGYDDKIRIVKAPLDIRALVGWLAEERQDDYFERTDWSDVCRSDIQLAVRGLKLLARRGVWPIDHWRNALQVWSSDTQASESWNRLALTLDRMPDDVFIQLASPIAWWFESVSKTFWGREAHFIITALRLLAQPYSSAKEGGSQINHAINHPVGQATQALLHRWFRDSPKDGDNLPNELKEVLTALLTSAAPQYLHAQVLLAANAISLFRVDPSWATEYLVPAFLWANPKEASTAIWEGFLWSPRLHWPFLKEIKASLLETASHFDRLGESGAQYARFMTYLALERNDSFTKADLRMCMLAMPGRALKHVARALANALAGAEAQRSEYWKNRVKPFWHDYWPKNLDHVTSEVSDAVVGISLSAGDEFEEAVAMTRGWLLRTNDSYRTTRDLLASGTCKKFPHASLDLMDLCIGDRAWQRDDIRECLAEIAETAPEIVGDPRYERLLEQVALP